MKNLQRIRKPVIVLAVIAAVAMGAMRLSAFNPQPDPPAFGLVAMTPSEAARFNTTCPNVKVHGVDPCPCVGALLFYDAQGALISSARYQLTPGQSFSLDVTSSQVRFDGTGRAELQPIIVPLNGRTLPTVEVFEWTDPSRRGKTQVYVNPAVPRLSWIKSM